MKRADNEWWLRFWEHKSNFTLLDICLELHAHHTGSSEPMLTQRYVNLWAMLVFSLNTWNEETNWPVFDGAVRSLIMATLYECHEKSNILRSLVMDRLNEVAPIPGNSWRTLL